MHVSNTGNNLVFGALLNRHEFKMVFESQKFVLIKFGLFIGKAFATSGMFKLNAINELLSTSAYVVESCNIWVQKNLTHG